MEQFFATCPRGLEKMLGAELQTLGAKEAEIVDGGVGFSGALALCYAVNLESRVASRVLWRVGGSGYRGEEDIYRAARILPWPRLFDVGRSIRVNVSAIKSPVKSLEFVALRVKDAACDVFREAGGRRPSVDTQSPDVRIHAFLTRDEVTFYLDTSGDALFKRGWRTVAGEAPLRENLAAGILRLTGWSAPTPLLDPMCGSGTFLVEAAMMALDVAPGLNRSFGFERLANYDNEKWQALRKKALTRRKPAGALPVHGRDKSGEALALAHENLAQAGLTNAVQLKQMDILDGGPPGNSGIIVMNPPYGERVAGKDDLAAFYPKLGDALKQRHAGWTAYVLSADPALPRLIGLKATRRVPLYNGALECRLFEYRMVAGSLRPAREARSGQTESR
ncbi:MAG: THUMP domain-containing class I SAM-dependent RNA methyltransferase [Burkholderiales bacterium]